MLFSVSHSFVILIFSRLIMKLAQPSPVVLNELILENGKFGILRNALESILARSRFYSPSILLPVHSTYINNYPALMITGEVFKVWREVLEPQPPSWRKKKKRTESFAKFGMSVKFVVGRELASMSLLRIFNSVISFLNWWFFDRLIPESPHLSGGVPPNGWEGRLSIGTNQLIKYERRSSKNLSLLWVRFFVTKNVWAKRINIKNPSRANIITNSHFFSWTKKSTRESWDISLSEPPPSAKILKIAEGPRKKVSLSLPMNLPTSSSCVVCPLSSLFSPILTTTPPWWLLGSGLKATELENSALSEML